MLRDSFANELDRMGLTERAVDVAYGIFGGRSEEETHDHFSRRFAVGASRVQYALMGPPTEFSPCSDSLLCTLSAGEVAVLDLPCGSGALSATILASLTSLREQRLLPRLPLHLRVVGGDYSPTALSIFERMLTSLASRAADQGITFELQSCIWECGRPDLTHAMVDELLGSASATAAYVVGIADFSGALKDQELKKLFDEDIRSLFGRLAKRNVVLLWVEPHKFNTAEKLLKYVQTFIRERMRWFGFGARSLPGQVRAEYQVINPISNAVHGSGVQLVFTERWGVPD